VHHLSIPALQADHQAQRWQTFVRKKQANQLYLSVFPKFSAVFQIRLQLCRSSPKWTRTIFHSPLFIADGAIAVNFSH
jgi:hypothetical protein